MANKKQQELDFYDWQGVNREGRTLSGEIQAKTIILAKVSLSKQGITVKKIKKRSSSIFSQSGRSIKSADITLLTRQLSTMLQAGIPLLQSFDIIAKGQTKVRMRALVNSLKRDLETGITLSETFKREPLYFNELYCNLVAAGESSGSLETMLANIASYREKIESIKRKIKKALLYPSIVVIVGIVVSAILLIFVVPQFETLFKGFGATLPAFTMMVIYLSRLVQGYWYIVLGVAAILIFSIIYSHKHSPAARYFMERSLLKIPVIGRLLHHAAIARFARTLSITFAAGMPLYDALKLVEGATGNVLYGEATHKIREDVSTGVTMKTAMTTVDLFPNMVVQMVSIGEETGTLEKMLGRVADHYETEVDAVVDNLSTLIEPVIICVLGVLVGGLVIAMYLPIFKLGSVV